MEDDQQPNRWLVSYADFITLLLAFFVVMYSISQVNEGKYRILSESLLAAFKTPERSLNPINVGEINRRKEPVLGRDNTKPGVSSSGDNELTTDKQVSEGELAVLNADAQQSPEEFARLAEQIENALSELQREGLVQIHATEDWIELEFPSGLLFASGSDALGGGADVLLQRVAELLNQSTNLVRVRGFTDDVPAGGRFQSNWALSAARAVSVVQKLQSSGIQPERLAIEGYGQYAPVADNSTPEGRARNRRVVIAISRYIRGEPTPLPEDVSGTASENARQPAPLAEDAAGEFDIIRTPDGRLIIRGKGVSQPQKKP
jgi:chemotaxis protein MotB